LFERVGIGGAGGEVVEVIEVDADFGAIEAVALVVVDPGVAECFAGLVPLGRL
jgi:hypothetical protein